MNQKTVLVLVLALLLWLALRDRSSRATTNDTVNGVTGAPTFGTDHAGDGTGSVVIIPTPPAPPGPAPRSLEQIQNDFKVQLANPAYQAAAANPDIAASNAFNGQFIGKIT